MTGSIRHSARSLLRTPVLSGVAGVSVGISIALTVLILMVLRQSVLLPLPFPEASRIVTVMASGSADCGSCPDYLSSDALTVWQPPSVRSLSKVALYRTGEFVLDDHDASLRIQAALVRGDFFEVLGATALVGRLPDARDLRSGATSTAAISERFARRRGWETPSAALGKGLKLNGRDVVVVGVVRAGLEFPGDVDVWLNDLAFPIPGGAEARLYSALGRLTDGTTLEQVQAELTGVGLGNAMVTGASFRAIPLITPLPEYLRRAPGAAVSLLVVSALVAFLLAAANLQTLLIVRAIDQSGAMALRLALGASRSDLLRIMGTESALLTVAGTLPGFGVALLSRGFLASYLAAAWGRPVTLSLDEFTLAAATVLALLLALAGLVGPAFHSLSIDVRQTLQEHAATTTATRRTLHLRMVFVIAEIAVAILLVAGTGLLIRSYGTLGKLDLGYDPSRLVAARVDLSGTALDSWPEARRWASSVVERLDAEGTQGGAFWVGTAPSLAVGPRDAWTVIEGRPDPGGLHRLIVAYHVSDGFFALLRLHAVQGRLLEKTDRLGSEPVVVINEEAAEAWWHGESPLGRRIKLGPLAGEMPWLTVVGVVPNTQAIDERGLNHVSYRPERQWPLVFLPFDQSLLDLRGRPLPLSDLFVAVPSSSQPQPTIHLLQQTVGLLGGSIPPPVVGLLSDLQRAHSIYPQIQFSERLLGGFAGFALLLAAIGVFGVISENIRSRTAEIGIRRALGAPSASIASLVSRPGLLALGTGVVLGGIVAVTFKAALLSAFFGITAQNHSGLLLSISPQDTSALLTAAAWFSVVTAVAIAVPLRSALIIDPMQALRQGR